MNWGLGGIKIGVFMTLCRFIDHVVYPTYVIIYAYYTLHVYGIDTPKCPSQWGGIIEINF